MMDSCRLPQCLVPEWPAPVNVQSLISTRVGGFSRAPFDSFNLATHVGDDALTVARNRALLRSHTGVEPVWLEQVHGTHVVELDERPKVSEVPVADASVSRHPGVACAVLTADCLPVLLCDRGGTVVAAVHAGWRGLVAGVIEATIERMHVRPEDLLVWLGPAIGPRAFEVGDEVRALFLASDPALEAAFTSTERPGKWMADLYMIAMQRLLRTKPGFVGGGGDCTFSDERRFYSYRREGTTGRFASLIWLNT